VKVLKKPSKRGPKNVAAPLRHSSRLVDERAMTLVSSDRRAAPSGRRAEGVTVSLSLEDATVRALDAMAARWACSRADAVTRLVERAERAHAAGNRSKPWAERVAAGLCGKCGTDRPLETVSMCAPCAEVSRAAQKRLKLRRAQPAE